MNEPIDFGSGVIGRWTRWAPDRTLNQPFADLPDIERLGLILQHQMPDGTPHDGVVMFDLPGVRRIFPNNPVWIVHSWEPLTLTPSVKCSCGFHGFITDGKWRSC
jgi:hypothetical protein